MRIKSNFCGIFATVFMVATAITIVSCSQDDDYYDSDMYTLAEEMDTRSGGDPGGGGDGGTPAQILYYYLNDKDVNVHIFPSVDVIHHASCSINDFSSLHPEATSNLVVTDSSIYYNVDMKHRNERLDNKYGKIGILINYYIRFRDRRTSHHRLDSIYKEDFIELDTIYFPVGVIPIQPIN